MPSFNLVDDRWIPCVLPDGERTELSLRDTLVGARFIRELQDSSPLVTIALHRLLLAVLHRTFQPANVGAWIPLWRAGAWDPTELNRYLDTWRHRFDLFDPIRPFAQVPPMPDAREKPITALLLEAASGNNATLFDHGRVEGQSALRPARAACYLLAHQAYAIGFGMSKPFYLKDAPLTRGVTALAYGNNLFETLALNLMPGTFWSGSIPGEPGQPFWEWEDVPGPVEAGTSPRGYADYLTWQSRRIHLVAGGEPLQVARCQIQQNYCLPERGGPWDPCKVYRQDEKRGWVPLCLSAEKAAWRDCDALLQGSDSERVRPQVLDWLAKVDGLRREGRIAAQASYDLGLFGIATALGKAASVQLWRGERLPLPLAYLSDGALAARLAQALTLAEHVHDALLTAAWVLAKELVTRLDVEPLARQLALDTAYWPRLERPFRRLLVELPQDEAAIGRWAQEVTSAARVAFQSATRQAKTSGSLRSTVQAEEIFRRSLYKALRMFQEETDHASGEGTAV